MLANIPAALPLLPGETGGTGLVHFAPWQSILVIVVSGLAAVMAHYALAIFNDGARPFLLDFIQKKTSRGATAAIVFGLSAGFVFGLGAPMALSTGVLNPWLIFLPVEILGLIAPWAWLAGLFGLAWGAVCVFGLGATNALAGSLTVDFISALQQMSTPILWFFAVFPIIAIANQFGKVKGLITFFVEIAAILVSTLLWPGTFAGSLAMAVGVIMLIGFAIAKDRAQRKQEQADLGKMSAEEREIFEQAKRDAADSVNQLFGPNANRLRKNVWWLALLGGGVAMLAASGIFGGGEATSFMIADGKLVEAAQIDFFRAFGFIPLIATTALASGAYAMAGFTFVYPAGYLLAASGMPLPLVLILAFAAGAAIFFLEVLGLSTVGRWMERWPSIRDAADHIRNAITESLGLAITLGSMMAALAMGGGLGLFIVGGLYLLNEALGRPVVRMAAGPTAVILGGILLNLLAWVGLFEPLA